jgi:flagellar protein FliO/FliZ
MFMSAFGENRTLAFVVAGVVFIVLVAFILLVARAVFGSRLRLPGGRARQPRLGIVDAFDVDRQRQLVIVRRDNVEHLIMIGGPNDLVIESAIIRAEARDQRAGREREQPSIGGLSWPAGPASEAPASSQPAPAPSRPPIPIPEPPPLPVAAPAPTSGGAPAGALERPPEPLAGPPLAGPAPAPAAPRPGVPARSAGPALGTPGERPPRPPLPPLPRREPRPLPPFLANRGKATEPAAAGAAAGAAAAAGTAPAASPPSEPAPEAAAAAEPAPSSETPPAAATEPPPATPEPAAAPAARPTPPKIELDPLESLEEEMAKLLGRSPNP